LFLDTDRLELSGDQVTFGQRTLLEATPGSLRPLPALLSVPTIFAGTDTTTGATVELGEVDPVQVDSSSAAASSLAVEFAALPNLPATELPAGRPCPSPNTFPASSTSGAVARQSVVVADQSGAKLVVTAQAATLAGAIAGWRCGRQVVRAGLTARMHHLSRQARLRHVPSSSQVPYELGPASHRGGRHGP
jgi:hypothetical protein